MISTIHKYTFGPVPSRRLGRSLGIDIVPYKMCTYDCIYCQLGRTTDKTMTRMEFVNIDDVLHDTCSAFKKNSSIDYLTLSGSGEPTLHSGIGKLISALKREFDCPVAVLTNGSLLFDPDVAQSLLEADVVMPTLAADCRTVYQCVHRPHPALHFDTVIKGIIDFAKEFKNQLWLEVFLLDGITAIEGTLKSMIKIVDEINPAKVHLNTATRPPADDVAIPVSKERLESFIKYFGQCTEVVTDFKYNLNQKFDSSSPEDITSSIVELLKRRPCTNRDIASALSLNSIEVVKIIGHLVEDGKIEQRKQSGKIYYTLKIVT